MFEFVESRLPEYAKRYLATHTAEACANTDVWVLASLLQKAVRRGDLDVARRAGHQLVVLDPKRVWRRLMTLTLEDIGIGDPHAAAEILAVATSVEVRRLVGVYAEMRKPDETIRKAREERASIETVHHQGKMFS